MVSRVAGKQPEILVPAWQRRGCSAAIAQDDIVKPEWNTINIRDTLQDHRVVLRSWYMLPMASAESGEEQASASSKQLLQRVGEFAAEVDLNDSVQVEASLPEFMPGKFYCCPCCKCYLSQLLEQIRAQTLRLCQARGDFDKPSTFRSWNQPQDLSEPGPLALNSYRWKAISIE